MNKIPLFFRGLSDDQIAIATQLASCISMASIKLSSSIHVNFDPNRHEYWETRESSVELGRKLGIRVQAIIGLHNYHSNVTLDMTLGSVNWDQIKLDAEVFWPDVASPRFIVTDVMNS